MLCKVNSGEEEEELYFKGLFVIHIETRAVKLFQKGVFSSSHHSK